VNAETVRVFDELDVRPRDADAALGSLSGGNQQKVVAGRELGRRPKLLLAVHPTRGVDVGAIEKIHAAILAERDRGTGVLLVSADLAEVLALSDRVLVLYGGRIVHETPAASADERALSPFMTGAGA
jgi:simple sugar transport system ATP-binding protein